MFSASLLPLLVGVAAAQSTILALQNMYAENKTITAVESNPTATTYEFRCPTLPPACFSAMTSALNDPSNTQIDFDAAIASIYEANPTGNACAEVPYFLVPKWFNCFDYTMVQGPSTHEFHVSVGPDWITSDINCHWEGEMTTADLTCTHFSDGLAFTGGGSGETAGSEVTVWGRETVASESLVAPYTLVSAGSQAVKTTSGSTGSNAAAGNAPQNTGNSAGLAPAGPLPTGLIGFVGGAAAVLAAAVAL